MKKKLATGAFFALLFSGISLIETNNSFAQYNDDDHGASEGTETASNDTGASNNNNNSESNSNSNANDGDAESDNGAEDRGLVFNRFFGGKTTKSFRKSTSTFNNDVRLYGKYDDYIKKISLRIEALEDRAKESTTYQERLEIRKMLEDLYVKRIKARAKFAELGKKIGADIVVSVNPVGRVRERQKNPTPTINPPITPVWDVIKEIMDKYKEVRAFAKDPFKEAKAPVKRNLRPAVQQINPRTHRNLSFPNSRGGFDDSTRGR